MQWGWPDVVRDYCNPTPRRGGGCSGGAAGEFKREAEMDNSVGTVLSLTHREKKSMGTKKTVCDLC